MGDDVEMQRASATSLHSISKSSSTLLLLSCDADDDDDEEFDAVTNAAVNFFGGEMDLTTTWETTTITILLTQITL